MYTLRQQIQYKNIFYAFTGRIKELIITSGGENVAPNNIEHAILSELPYLSNAMVIGDKKKYLTVLVTLKVRYERTKIQMSI